MEDRTAGKATRGVLKAGVFLMALLLAEGVSMGGALQATPDHQDFGSLDEGVPARATVEIRNTGAQPVEITNVRTS